MRKKKFDIYLGSLDRRNFQPSCQKQLIGFPGGGPDAGFRRRFKVNVLH